MRARRPALAAACLGALLALSLLAGCGGSETTTSGGHGKETAQSRPAPPKSAFPAAGGRTLKEILEVAEKKSELKIQPQAMVFYEGRNRYPFEVVAKGKGGRPGAAVDDAEVAIYYSRVPPPSKKSKAAEDEPAHTGRGEALEQPAIGPFPAKIETLATKPEFESSSTAEDPEAAGVVYSTEIPLPENGQWRLAALVKEGDGYSSGGLLPSADVGEFTQIPRPGEAAPTIHTPTAKDVGGDLSKITTRVPPDTLNKVDYAEALGKEPILLLFATPQFCQSRVCGPVVDKAQEAQARFGNQAQFIHMEIYNDNDPGKFARPQVRAFHLPSEPWLFAIDRGGTVTAAIEGAFGSELLDETVEKGGGEMSDKATEPDTELLQTFAEEARRRCDVISAGLATATTDFETMRAEAHALRGTAGVVGLRRLSELAGLMESDLAEAKKTGTIRGGRDHQIADAAKALAEGAVAAAKGEEEPPDVGRSLAQLFSA